MEVFAVNGISIRKFIVSGSGILGKVLGQVYDQDIRSKVI